MTPCTNKFLRGLLVALAACAFAACDKPQPNPELETVVVETEPQTPPVKVDEPANETAEQADKTAADTATAAPAQTAQTETTAADNATPKATAQPNAKPEKTLYPNEVIIRFKAWDKNLNTLKTEFKQTTFYDGVTISMSRGNLFYRQKGHLLRLDSHTTDGATEQSAVTDKDKIFILDGQGRQITTLSWGEWQSGQTNQALFDFGNYTALLNRHHIQLTAPNELLLTPKEGETYSLYITLGEDDFPTKLKLVNDLAVTEAVLENTQKNKALEFETFGGFFE